MDNKVSLFVTFLGKIYKDIDQAEEDGNTQERIFNNDPVFTWKCLRLLLEINLNKINNGEMYKLLSISENYYNQFK